MAEVLLGMVRKHAASILPFFSVVEGNRERDRSFWAKGNPQWCLTGVTLSLDQINLIVCESSVHCQRHS